MRRRAFIAAGVGASAATVLATQAGCSPAPAPGVTLSGDDMPDTVAKLRARYLPQFDAEYVDNVILPYFQISVNQGERPVLPLIDVALTKENALPFDLWGLLSKTWKPAPEEGVTVFLQGLEKRGPDNRRKRIYMSAVTPDLYSPMYQGKVIAFWDQLFGPQNAGKPLMRAYLDTFWDLYWDLHLGVKGVDVPIPVRQIGESFNTVLAYRDPTLPVVHDNYLLVRRNRDFLKKWIADRIADIQSGKTPEPQKTFAYYWLRNSAGSEFFQPQDVVFECFHNFVAFSQWGNSLYNVMKKLGRDTGEAQAKDSFTTTMSGSFDGDGSVFTPLERLVMELFRTISPNGGSISALAETRPTDVERHGYIVSPHASTSLDPVQWTDPTAFDPSRYQFKPTSQEVNQASVERMGLAKCPFDLTSFDVLDGRRASLNNSGWGTVFGVVDGRPLPVCDYAGFAPFGFGYRRCPGEQLTIRVFEDLLRKVWREKIDFVPIGGQSAEVPIGVDTSEALPIGPTTVIRDDLGFVRPA